MPQISDVDPILSAAERALDLEGTLGTEPGLIKREFAHVVDRKRGQTMIALRKYRLRYRCDRNDGEDYLDRAFPKPLLRSVRCSGNTVQMKSPQFLGHTYYPRKGYAVLDMLITWEIRPLAHD